MVTVLRASSTTTSSTYTPVAADEGSELFVTVTYRDGAAAATA